MLIKIIKEFFKGKTFARTLMNLELSKYTLSGKVLDIGGGKSPSYFRFFKKEDYELVNIDIRKGEDRIEINLEKDSLPLESNSIDKILMLNVLEHIYNYKFTLREAKRVLKNNGQIIGFVPFLVGYHPDPNDYFRYTGEALQKIFEKTDFKKIEIKEVGRGPFVVSFDIIGFMFPKFLRLFFMLFYYFADKIVVKIKPNLKKKFSLGYLFVLKK